MEEQKEKILKDAPIEKIMKEILPMLRNYISVSQIFRSDKDYNTENPQIEFEEEFNSLTAEAGTKAFYGFFSFDTSGEYHYLKIFFKGSLIIDIYAAKENQKAYIKEKIYNTKDTVPASIIKNISEIFGDFLEK